MNLIINKMNDSLYEFTECGDIFNTGNLQPYVDAYLLIGEKRAVLIDALQITTDLHTTIRKLTKLPLDVLITHGHGDHAGASIKGFAHAGCRIYMNMLDYDDLKVMNPEVQKEWFTDIRGGEKFLLGNYSLEAIACGGHTAGCMIFLDRENHVMFSGDTIGSGNLWMQLPCSLPLILFKRNVEHVINEIRGMSHLTIYPGHRNQSPVQLTEKYVKDVYITVSRILNGSLEGKEETLDFKDRHMVYRSASHGQLLSLCYDPDNLHFSRKDPAIEKIKDEFISGQIRSGSKVMDYMLYSPRTEEGKLYPLLIYLHGAGERGNDPRLVLANSGGYVFASKEWQDTHPCYIIAPQVAANESWVDDQYIELIMKVVTKLPMESKLAVDFNRVYITGISMGGMGTWKAISKYPSLFAAAMPICGAGDPFEVRAARDVPVWAFHAADDPVVPANDYMQTPFGKLAGSERLVQSLREAGNRKVSYTEYPKGWMEANSLHPHLSWIPAYNHSKAKEWLFSNNRKDRYEIHFIMPGFYWIEDCYGSSIYLIEGKDKALIVDTGMADNNFTEMIESLTKLPYSLAITHNHYDHMYHLDQFEQYYMNEKDVALFEEPFIKEALADKDFSKCKCIGIKDGDIISLGGDYDIEVFELAGHTPGSVVFFDRNRKIALSGDALGVWLQVPGATDISVYKGQLEHFLERISDQKYEGFCMMSGHKKQEGGYYPYGEEFVPNDLCKVKDMITLCDKLLREDIEFEPFILRTFSKPAFTAHYGRATIVFTEDQLQ